MSTVRPSAGTTYATSRWSPGPPSRTTRGRAGDVRLIGEHRLDLLELDPEAAQLDLEVDAAEVLERPVLAPAHEVAGAVEPGIRRVGERDRDELLGGQLGPLAGSRGASPSPPMYELAGDADRLRLAAGRRAT